jgi:hypothetical protein
MFGLNVQAVCDHAYRFLWVGVSGPGGMSDQTNYELSNISTLVEQLPTATYVVGDNAYQVTEDLLTPFSGSQKGFIWNDSFNFHLSQVRIKIEQTFGIFNSRWAVFQRPLMMGFRTIPLLIMSAAKLHNFIMRMKYPSDDLIPSSSQAAVQDFGSELVIARPSTPDAIQEVATIAGSSSLREVIVQHLRSNSLTRPAYNTSRNASK